MTTISKTRGIVLQKRDHGDTSMIVTFFTEDYGKITGIVKGARSSRSRAGAAVDLFNLVELVFYNKEHTDIQLITQIELISFYENIKVSLEKLKYSSAAVEVINKILPERESGQKIFRSLQRLLELIEKTNLNPGILFVKFLLFLIKETGYGFLSQECSNCRVNLREQSAVYFSIENGFICNGCRLGKPVNIDFSKEQYESLLCLSAKDCGYDTDSNTLNKILFFLEMYLKHHYPDFKGIVSLHLY